MFLIRTLLYTMKIVNVRHFRFLIHRFIRRKTTVRSAMHLTLILKELLCMIEDFSWNYFVEAFAFFLLLKSNYMHLHIILKLIHYYTRLHIISYICTI